MDGLEKTVATLVKSIEDQKNMKAREIPEIVVEQPQPSFAEVAATAAKADANNRTVNTNARVEERAQGNTQRKEAIPRQRLPSVKRKN